MPRLPRGMSSGAVWRLQGHSKYASDGAFVQKSRSRKRRRSRPPPGCEVQLASPLTGDDVRRICVPFAKTRFADPGPNWSCRRRSRGTEVRFGPLVDSYCRMQRAAYAGGDPEAPWS